MEESSMKERKDIIILLFGIFLLCSQSLEAQIDSYIGVRFAEGIVAAHSPSMRHLIQGHSQTYEVSFISESDGQKEWHHALGHPRQGVSFYHMRSGNKEVIGGISSLYGFLDFPVVKKGTFSNYFKFGSGISYVQHSFDRVDNFRNVAIGSSFNLGFVFANNIEFQLNHLILGAGISLVHSSSGAFQIPNLGLNVPSLDFIVSYRIGSKERSMYVAKDSVNRKNNLSILLSTGPRAVNVSKDEKHFVHTLQVEGAHRSANIMSYGLGFDLFYNEALPYLDLQIISKDPIVQLGGKLLANIHLDRATLYTQVGSYISSTSKLNGFIYNRFGGRYSFTNNLLLNFSLKTHLSEADYFELGVGYKFE